MRNLIKLATIYAIILTEADVEQLGYDVLEADFKEYFEIAPDAKKVEAGKFNPNENSAYMNDAEAKELVDKFRVAEAKGKGVAKPDKAKDEAKKEKAKNKAKAEAEEKPKKEPKPKKELKVGVIASILEILKNTKKPISQEEIFIELKKRFPEKGETMKKTVYCQLSGKTQPLRIEKEKGVKIEITTKEEIIDEKTVQTKSYRIIS